MMSSSPSCRLKLKFKLADCLAFLLATTLSLCSAHGQNSGSDPTATVTTAEGPSKEKLLDTLTQFYSHLEKSELKEASEYLVLPPGFQLKMLEGLIERRELSINGINELAKSAEFKSAVEGFGEARAKTLAERANVDVANCYGFHYESEGVVAEVLAVWQEGKFKLLRFDDVGKIEPAEDIVVVAEEIPSPELTPSPQMSNDEIEKAKAELSTLAEAAAKSPTDASVLSRYAKALWTIGNVPAAWQQLIAANGIDPKNKDVAAGLHGMWREFFRLNVFTVGLPRASLEGILGPPQQEVPIPNGTRLIYAFYAVDFNDSGLYETIDLRGATEALFNPTEAIEGELDGRMFRIVARMKTAGSSTSILALPGEDLNNWTEQLEIQRMLNLARTSLTVTTKLMGKQIVAANPNSRFTILKTFPTSVIYETIVSSDQPDLAKYQIAKLFKGSVDVHRLAYTIKGAEPTAEDKAKWIAILEKSTLAPIQVAKEPESTTP